MRSFLATLILTAMMSTGILAADNDIDEDQETYIRANTIFFLYHELGHALIDILRLPVLAQEEDAADVLSVVLSEVLNDPDDTRTIMLAAADNFAYMAEVSEADGYELAFWDSHGLDMQRYYTVLCLYYGADVNGRQDTADEGGLPDDRQESCADEYTLAEESWGPVLDDIERGQNVGSKGLILEVTDRPETDAEQIVLDALQTEVDVLNHALDLRTTVKVFFERCGEANAFYDPEKTSITICAELAGLFLE